MCIRDRLSSSNNIYDALIDDFEPEMNTEKFDKIFANLRKNLIEIRNNIFENKKPVNELSFNFDKNLIINTFATIIFKSRSL